MKAETLLKKIKESEGMKTPKYANANTPDNHVDAKGMKKVSDPKKGLGKDPTMKPRSDVGIPKKKERRATASGRIDPVNIKPKKTKGARYGIQEESGRGGVMYIPGERSSSGEPVVVGFIDQGGKRKRQFVVSGVDKQKFESVSQRVGTGEEAYDFWSNKSNAKMALGRLNNKSLTRSFSESEVKAKPEKTMEPAKSVSVRTQQNDSPKNMADVGKPSKPESKSKMTPNSVSVKKMKVRGQISEIERLLGSKLKVNVADLFEDDFEDEGEYEIERIGVGSDDDLDANGKELDNELTDEEIEGQFKIVGTKNGKTQTLDVAPTEEKARELVGEFQLAFGDPWQISYEPV